MCLEQRSGEDFCYKNCGRMPQLDKTRIYTPSSMQQETISFIAQLVNDVYDVAEDNMWKEKGIRTNISEIESLIKEKRLMIAQVEEQIVGLVKISRIDEETGEFGMLVVDPVARGLKLGGALVESAEEWAREEGFQVMQLQLLTPRTWNHPTKEFLKGWYSRMGYCPVCTTPFAEDYPDLVNLLTCECDLTTWTKCL